MSRTRRALRRPGRPGALPAAGALGAAVLLAACGDSPTGNEGRNTSTGPRVGEVLSLNVQTNSACSSARYRGGRVAAVTEHAIVVADTSNPAGGFTDAEYASIGAAFDSLVQPVSVRNFGQPSDIDDNDRVIIFYTRAVNELTPAGVDYVVGGFFWLRDLIPKTGSGACAGSNDAEMFYMLVPDPTGTINGNVRPKTGTRGVRNSTVGVIGHEYQHLINASRRLYELNADQIDEEVWLNEGLSHIAEELLFFRAAGLSPADRPGQSPRGDLTATSVGAGAPLTALVTYNFANLSRFSSYLKAVDDSSAYEGNDGLATRGATWAFLRYAADRLGGDDREFFNRAVSTNAVGLANLRASTGANAGLLDWFRDWAVANYVDNAVSPLDARYQYPSYNFRSLLTIVASNNSRYPVRTYPLAAGVPQAPTVVGGSAAYFPFTVPAGGRASVRTRDGAGNAPAGTVRLSLVRTSADAAAGSAVTHYDAGQGADLTVANAAAGPASYALVAFNADTSTLPGPTDANGQATRVLRRTPVTVTATGVGEASAAIVAATQAGPTLARLEAAASVAPRFDDARVHARLRQIAQSELAGRVAGARAEVRARAAARGQARPQ